MLTPVTLRRVVPTLERKEVKQETLATLAVENVLVIQLEPIPLGALGKSSIPAMQMPLAELPVQDMSRLEPLHLTWSVAAIPKMPAKTRRSLLFPSSVLVQQR